MLVVEGSFDAELGAPLLLEEVLRDSWCCNEAWGVVTRPELSSVIEDELSSGSLISNADRDTGSHAGRHSHKRDTTNEPHCRCARQPPNTTHCEPHPPTTPPL